MYSTRMLGDTDMAITPVGLGAWAIGGPWQWGWGPQDDAESITTIRRALDLGINWIDTAAIYGLGHSEEVVAAALKGMADRPYVFTKCSLVWNEQREVSNSLKAASLRREVEASLRRLQTDVIDLYQIHWPNPDPEIEEGWETLAQLRREGKVRWIGVSNFNVAQMERAARIAPISSLQPPYSAIRREVDAEILPYCRRHNIGVIVYSPMQAGLLTGKMTRTRIAGLADDDWRKRDAAFNEPELTQNLALQELFCEIAAEQKVSVPAVAIAWTLHNPAVTAAIVGARRPDQLDDIADALTFRLDATTYDRIAAFIASNH
jgi:aryl-alcohol dehydrogenase-like predicted oxidoreductase